MEYVCLFATEYTYKSILKWHYCTVEYSCNALDWISSNDRIFTYISRSEPLLTLLASPAMVRSLLLD